MAESSLQDLENFIDDHYEQCNRTVDADMCADIPMEVPIEMPTQVSSVPKKQRLSLTEKKLGDVVRGVGEVVNHVGGPISTTDAIESIESSTPQHRQPEKKRKKYHLCQTT